MDSMLKGGVKVCQRQLVNEVLRPRVTEFARDLGREVATSIQRGFNASLLGGVQAVKLIRHHALRPSQSRPSAPWSSIERIRFKVDAASPCRAGSVLIRRMPHGS